MTTHQPVANARMYSVTPQVRADWKVLLGWVLARAGLDWPVIDYDPPAPLDALWARDDLGLAMMCGLPFAQRARVAPVEIDLAGWQRSLPTTRGSEATQQSSVDVPLPQLIAAPRPSPARYQGRAVYFTDLVVRAESSYCTLEETFGGRVGYTLPDSLSGGVALRAHLAPAYRERGRLYRAAVGNLIHARGVIDALVRGDIDVGPLDGYYHDLLRHNDPTFAARVRTVATTIARPIPPLIATAPLAPDTLAALRGALRDAGDQSSLADVRSRLLLDGFAFPEPADYAPLAALAAGDLPDFEALTR